MTLHADEQLISFILNGPLFNYNFLNYSSNPYSASIDTRQTAALDSV